MSSRTILVEIDDVTSLRARRWRQGKAYRIPRRAAFRQPTLDQPSSLAPRQHQRHFTLGNRLLGIVREDRLNRPDLVIAVRLDEIQPYAPCNLGIRVTHRAHQRLILTFRQIARGNFPAYPSDPVAKDQRAIPLDRIDPMAQQQGLQHRPSAFTAAFDIAAHDPEHLRDIHVRHTRGRTDLADHRRQRSRRNAPRQPVSPRVIVTIRPDSAVSRKLRERPCIPSPDEHARRLHHRAAVGRRHGVVFRRVPMRRNGGQILHLHQVVSRAVGILRQP